IVGAPDQAQRVFRPGDAWLQEDRGVQRDQLVLKRQRRSVIAVQRRLHQLRAQCQGSVGGDRDAAVAPRRHIGERRHILARKLDEIGAEGVALLRHPRQVAGRVLDADDVFEPVKPLHRLDRHVDDAAAGDVVDEDRNADGVVDGLEMLIEALLRRLVVVGRHHQHRVGAGLLGVAGEFDGLHRVVGARAGDDRHAPARLIDADVDDVAVLGVAQRRALAGGAGRHQAMRAGADLPIDQGAKGRLVEFPVLEWRHQGRHRTVKLRPLLHLALPAAAPIAAQTRATHSPLPAGAKEALRNAGIWLTFPIRRPGSLATEVRMAPSRLEPRWPVGPAAALAVVALGVGFALMRPKSAPRLAEIAPPARIDAAPTGALPPQPYGRLHVPDFSQVPAPSQEFAPQMLARFTTAANFYRKGQFPQGDAAAAAVSDPIARAGLDWMALRVSPTPARLDAFAKAYPD